MRDTFQLMKRRTSTPRTRVYRKDSGGGFAADPTISADASRAHPVTPCHRYFLGMAEGPVRNPAVDFYRVSGVVLIVLGHWLAGAVTYRDGAFGRQNPLVDQPWTQWLTWPFQAVPTFFLVAGYAGAVSWTHRRDAGGVSRQTWLRHRLARVLGPTTVYVGLVSAIVVV